MELPPSGGRMASQQEPHWPQHQEVAEMQPLLKTPHKPNRPPSPVERMMMLCSGAQSSTISNSNSNSSSNSSSNTSGGVGSKQQSTSKRTGRDNTSKTNESPSPLPTFARSNAETGALLAPGQPHGRAGSSSRSSSGSGTRPAHAPPTDGGASSGNGGGMQRHRKKDRADRNAPPTIQKYLQFAGGAAGGGGTTNSPTGLVAASENLYQPCGGLNLSHAAHTQHAAHGLGGELIGLKKGRTPASGGSPLDEPGAGTGTAAKGCCRKGGGVDLRTGYPEDNPDSIEVYRDKQQQQHHHHQGSSHPASLRIDMPDQCGGGPCHQLQYPSRWACGTGDSSFGSFPSGESGEHHTHQQQQQQQQQQPQHRQHRLGSDGTASCASDPATSGSSGVGSAEYSYAYCEPILLQRPLAPDGPPPPAGLAPSSSAYCVPVYHHHHPPALPLPQPHQPQRSIRGGFPAAGGRTVAAPYGARTLHHHHHHHHHNYTLPNSGTSTMATATTATTMATTTTGSLRALFTSFFRKSASSSSSSSSSSSASSSVAAAASGAVLNAAFSATPPFLDGVGGGVGDAGATLHHHLRPFGPLPPPERHSFTTCYGTKENIYEDIGSQSALQPSPGGSGAAASTVALVSTGPTMTTTTTTATATSSSITPAPTLPGSTSVASSPPSPPPLPPTAASPTGAAGSAGGAFHSVAAEWRRVQVQHERIIGELNLSVERLIMPSYDDEHCCPDQQHQQAQELSFRAPPAPPGGAAALSAASGVAAGALAGSSGGSQPAGPSKRLHFTSSPSTTLAVVERHSPTISYGKSYGDVDSGISSSSTSGTSYSSSILYRSITNYQQPEGGGGPMSSAGGQQQQSQQQQQQQQGRKVPLFGLRAPMAGSGAALTLPGARASGNCGRPGHFLHPSPSGAPGAPGVSGMNVTNAPDPPPPPDTVASCCFFTEHRQHQPQPGLAFPTAGPAHWTVGSSGHCFGASGSRPERPTGSGGNFWTRFRRLHGRLTSSSSSGKQQQQQQQLHHSQPCSDAFDDFSPAGPLWPMHQYAHHSHQYYHQHGHGPAPAHHLHHLQQQQQQQQHQPPLHLQPAGAGSSYEAHASPRDEGGDQPTISLHARDFPRRYPMAPPASVSTPAPTDSGSLVGLVVTHEEDEESKESQDNGSQQHQQQQQEVQPQPQETQQQTQENIRPGLNSPSSPSPSSSSSSSASSSSGSRSDSAASVGSSRSSPASVGSSDRTSAGSSPAPSPVAKLTTAG